MAAAALWYFSAMGFLSTPYFLKCATSLELPPSRIADTSRSFQLSIATERTKEMCTPSPRCRPEHSKHINTPYVTEAHWGPFAPQSTQIELPGSARSSRSTSFAMWCDIIALTTPVLASAARAAGGSRHRRDGGSVRPRKEGSGFFNNKKLESI
jgi:hypothetical protein